MSTNNNKKLTKKELQKELEDLRSENILLWDYLEELKKAEQMEIKEIEKKFMEELFKNSKNIGEA